MIFFKLSTSFLLLFTLSNAITITTTLAPAAQTSAAVINQEAMLENIIEDIFESTSLLQYITSADYDVATSFISFMVDIYSYSATEFPTSIFVNAFPFEDFKSIFSRLPNRDDILSSYSVTDLRVPSDYAVLIITETDETVTTETLSTTSHYFSQIEETSSPNIETTFSFVRTSTVSSTTKSSISYAQNNSSANAISSIGATTLLNNSNSIFIPKAVFFFLLAFVL